MRIYHGWYMVAVSALVYMLLLGSTYSAFGLFVLPVSAEFKLSRADINTALILVSMGSAVMSPFLGRLLDRFSSKRIMMISAVVFGLSLVGLGLSHSLWVNAAVLVVPLAAAFEGAGALTLSVFLARWFVAQRGRAMALAYIGASAGGIAVTPAIGLLIEHNGWRSALVTTGLVVGALLVMLAATLRDRPGPDDIEVKPAGPPVTAREPVGAPDKVRDIMARPQFWFVALGVALGTAVAQAITISIVPLALEGGLTMIQATTLVSVTATSAILGKLLLAWQGDRVDSATLLTGMFGLGALVNAALLYSESFPTLVGCAAVVGLTTGAISPTFYALLADRFGVPSFGTVRGLMAPIGSVLGIAGVRLAGEVYDRTGGYDALFAAFIGVELVAAVMLLATRFSPRAATVPLEAAT